MIEVTTQRNDPVLIVSMVRTGMVSLSRMVRAFSCSGLEVSAAPFYLQYNGTIWHFNFDAKSNVSFKKS